MGAQKEEELEELERPRKDEKEAEGEEAAPAAADGGDADGEPKKEGEEEEEDPAAAFMISRRPENMAFDQQKLKAWQVLLTPKWVIPVFIAIGLLFLPLGRWLQIVSDDVVEYRVQYDGDGMDISHCAITQINEGRRCEITIPVTEYMKAPIYVHYEINNFHQNHQKYIKSISTKQILGAVLLEDSLGDCAPLKTNGSSVLSPCGLIANTLFNDVFEVVGGPEPFGTNQTSGDPADLTGVNGTVGSQEYMLETGITWESDLKDRFVQPEGFAYAECALSETCNGCLGAGNFPACKDYTDPITGKTYKYWYPGDDNIQYLYESYPEVVSPLEGVLNEHFIVWMRTAALPTFRKLYGRIENDIPGGSTLTFAVTSNFLVSSIDAKKSLVVSNTSAFGGKNVFLGLAYMFVGALCLAVGSVFLVKHLRSPRPFGDPRLLVWD